MRQIPIQLIILVNPVADFLIVLTHHYTFDLDHRGARMLQCRKMLQLRDGTGGERVEPQPRRVVDRGEGTEAEVNRQRIGLRRLVRNLSVWCSLCGCWTR